MKHFKVTKQSVKETFIFIELFKKKIGKLPEHLKTYKI